MLPKSRTEQPCGHRSEKKTLSRCLEGNARHVSCVGSLRIDSLATRLVTSLGGVRASVLCGVQVAVRQRERPTEELGEDVTNAVLDQRTPPERACHRV